MITAPIYYRPNQTSAVISIQPYYIHIQTNTFRKGINLLISHLCVKL